MGEGLASLFAAVVDLDFELVSERLDGGFGLLQLGFGGGDLVLVEPGGGGGVFGLGDDGPFEQFGVGVEGEQGGEDGLFEDLGADAFAGAGVFAVALAAPAGDEPGEQVVGVLVRGSAGRRAWVGWDGERAQLLPAPGAITDSPVDSALRESSAS